MKIVDFHDYKINISIAEHEQDKEFINSIYTLANKDELVIREKGMPYIYSRIKLDGHKLLITNICSISFFVKKKNSFSNYTKQLQLSTYAMRKTRIENVMFFTIQPSLRIVLLEIIRNLVWICHLLLGIYIRILL